MPRIDVLCRSSTVIPHFSHLSPPASSGGSPSRSPSSSLEWLDGGWLTVVRFVLAAPLLALAGRRGLRAAATPPIMLAGAVGYGLVIVLQNAGIERTSVSHAALIVGAVPALVALMAACERQVLNVPARLGRLRAGARRRRHRGRRRGRWRHRRRRRARARLRDALGDLRGRPAAAAQGPRPDRRDGGPGVRRRARRRAERRVGRAAPRAGLADAGRGADRTDPRGHARARTRCSPTASRASRPSWRARSSTSSRWSGRPPARWRSAIRSARCSCSAALVILTGIALSTARG